MELKFRPVRADEIDCRVATVSEKGCSLLLYKDARCDQNILDETVGAMNWQRKHTRDNANCTVEIWDSDKNMWVSKEDTGTESFTEKEKGLASDSFKRACFNWGIGRELYTAPFIWINANDVKLEPKNGKYTTYDKFFVKSMEVKDGKITSLQIANEKTNKVVYKHGQRTSSENDAPRSEEEADSQVTESVKAKKIDKKYVDSIISKCEKDGVDQKVVLDRYNLKKLSDMTFDNYRDLAGAWDKEIKGAK